jgi:hypothetical protein
LAKHGQTRAPRQIRSWRAGHLLDAIEVVERRGYGTSDVVRNTPATFERALRISEVAGPRRISFDRLVIRLFVAREPVELRALRSALARMLDQFERTIDKAVGGTRDPDEMERAFQAIARTIAPRTAFGRFLLGRVGDKPSAKENALDKVVTQRLASQFTLMAVAFLGGDVRQFDIRDPFAADNETVDTVDELLKDSGLRGFTDDRVSDQDLVIVPEGHLSHREDFLTTLESMHVVLLRAAVMTASAESLEWGRDNAMGLVTLVRNFARNVRRLGGPTNAFGMAAGAHLTVTDELIAFFTPMILVLSETVGRDQIDNAVAELRPAIQLQEHLSLFLDFLPRRFRRFVGMDGELRLAKADLRERREYVGVLQEFDAQHPGVLALETVRGLAT